MRERWDWCCSCSAFWYDPAALQRLFQPQLWPLSTTTDPSHCNNCQKVLYIASLYYNKQRSKPFLRRKVKHLCKRYYEYRRHCLSALVPKYDEIGTEMDNAIAQGEYQPVQTCVQVAECDESNTPMNFSTIDVDDLDGSGLDLFFDID